MPPSACQWMVCVVTDHDKRRRRCTDRNDSRLGHETLLHAKDHTISNAEIVQKCPIGRAVNSQTPSSSRWRRPTHRHPRLCHVRRRAFWSSSSFLTIRKPSRNLCVLFRSADFAVPATRAGIVKPLAPCTTRATCVRCHKIK
jgi:hypothetical protein